MRSRNTYAPNAAAVGYRSQGKRADPSLVYPPATLTPASRLPAPMGQGHGCTSTHTIEVDCDAIRHEDATLERSGSPRRWIGHWHTHPGSDAPARPSKRDREFFAWDCREWIAAGRSAEHYVALIFTPKWDSREGRPSWVHPIVTGWHMQAVAADQFILTPANVEVEK